MGKYLELFLGEVGDLTEKTKLENKPYVAYSTKLGKVTYTVVSTSTPDEPAIDGPADNEIWYTSSNGDAVTPYKTGVFGANIVSNTYENGKGVITFDGPVTSIGYQAFYNCSSLTSVAIGNSVKSIENYAFRSCYSLTSVAIGNSVESIGNSAFFSCSFLTSVTLPNSVTSIGNEAFRSCSRLTPVTIPNSVTYIGESVFWGCSALTSITFEGTIEQWNSITKGGDLNTNVPATYVQCSDGQVTL